MQVDLIQRIGELSTQEGSLRNLSRAIDVDVSYLSRLADGSKTNPSDEVLAKLGLRRIVTYERVKRTRGVVAAEAEFAEMRQHGNHDDAVEAAAHLERVRRTAGGQEVDRD